jgi:hypothetical protein
MSNFSKLLGPLLVVQQELLLGQGRLLSMPARVDVSAQWKKRQEFSPHLLAA